jgi:predicted dienelactone hydrolase
MRTLELLIWIVTALWGGWSIARPPARLVHVTFGVVVALMGFLHLALEGARFQMLPAYGLGVVLALVAVIQRMPVLRPARPGRSRVKLAAATVAFASALLVAGSLPTVFPVFAFEQPTGPYVIGTAVYTFPNGPAWPEHPDERRDLAVQVWYPADPQSSGSRAPMTTRPDALAAAYASLTGMPAAMFDHLRLIHTHAIANAPVSNRQAAFPVVLFSPGFGVANRSQSIFQMEALASHGFIVAAIDHTGLSGPTIFPDGRVVSAHADVEWPTMVDAKVTGELDTWHADVRFVLDQLEAVNQADPEARLTHHLDLDRIGYLGASFGGSVAVHTLVDEPRIKAGVAQDGKPYFHDEALTELHRPLMYMQSAAPYIPSTDAQLAHWGLTQSAFRTAEQDHYSRQMRLFSAAGGPYYNVFIRRTDHMTFSDLYLVIDVPDFMRLNIRRAHHIINDYTVAFFDRYLNNEASSLVDGATPSPYPEVTVASRNVTPANARTGR